MLSSTRKDYKENYEGRLSVHKKSYFENDETSFLELELNNYTKYYNSLIKISDFFKNNTHKDLRVNSAITDVISDLKKINEPVFNEIFTIEKTKVEIDKVELDNGFVDEMIRGFIPGRVKIDFEKLKNCVTSAKRILDFIGQQLTILLSPNKNATSIYLTGHLPQDISKVQDEVPCKGKSVNNLDNVNSNVSNTIKSYDSYDNMKITIEEYLKNIVDDINPNDFKILVDALYSYFTTGDFPKLNNQIRFKPVNKKRVGWALKVAYKNIKRGTLKIDYFRFAKENINLFSKEKIDTTHFNKSKFYKYFHTNPAN